MLRSLIAYVFFLLAMAAIPLAGLQSARAEMPFEAWLSEAADSLDQQIDQQREFSWQAVNSMGKRTAESFDRVIDQCRLGVGGQRGLQFARAIDLLVELRDSGVAGVAGVAGVSAPAKNWNFPAENFELQRCWVVRGDARSHQVRELKAAADPMSAPIVENFSAVLGHGSAGQRLFEAASLITQEAKKTMVRLEEAVYRPAQPLVQAANLAWDSLMVTSAGQNRSEMPDSPMETPEKSTLSDASRSFKVGVLMNYWLEVSYSAQAKLNWLTSKVRHIAEACLKSIEPQFLILEFDFVETHRPGDGAQDGAHEATSSHPSVAGLPHSTGQSR